MVLITVEGLRGKEKDHDGPEQEFHQDLPLGCQLSTLFSKIEEEGKNSFRAWQHGGVAC